MDHVHSCPRVKSGPALAGNDAGSNAQEWTKGRIAYYIHTHDYPASSTARQALVPGIQLPSATGTTRRLTLRRLVGLQADPIFERDRGGPRADIARRTHKSGWR